MIDGAQPHGEVNDVCWKLLGIAGLGFTILGGVIVVLARELWRSAKDRLADAQRIKSAAHGDGNKED